ncbi:hypothetical protein F383_27168 [Gossypium arboreum]|uniref:Uncharacterized protein n=1 Tax=Gossypium arboreum TaxID=29729 RepID=A0A0B0PBP4_GOSAR|nr:hypothetical protein F383_27168 [Gossypium arboreum]
MPLSQTGSYSHTYIKVIYQCHRLARTSHIRILCHEVVQPDLDPNRKSGFGTMNLSKKNI